jgi:hypothetical protein
MFEHFRVGKFTLRLRALSDLHLPAYKGSTLRGGFGQALKQVTCALKRQDSRQCLLSDRCVYVYLFETPPPADAEIMRLYPSAPHPFVIEPPLGTSEVIQRGALLEFGLIIIGKAIDYLPYFIYAFKFLGDRGIGKRQGKFILESVFAASQKGNMLVYESEEESLRRPPLFLTWEDVEGVCKQLEKVNDLSFQFITPTRIKFEGHLVSEPEFHHLMRSLLRRLSTLSYFHCGQKLDLDFQGLIERSRNISRVHSSVHWHDWDRYSNRQKQKMTLGGFVGEVSYHGEFAEFLPLLAWGRVFHIGKAGSFGLGRFEFKEATLNPS